MKDAMKKMLLVTLGVLMAGCAKPAGVLFGPTANGPSWPPPPDAARIVYLGKIETSADLKPAVDGFEAMGEAMFGKKESRSMLTPMAVCTDGRGEKGRLFVADSNAQLVHVFDFGTRKYAMWKPGKKEPPLGQPVGVAWDGARARLLVADSAAGAIVVFDGKGKYGGMLGMAGTFERPVGVTVDAARDRIFVADAKKHQVLVLSADGRVTRTFGSRGTGPGEFNYPTNVAVDVRGVVYVSDSLNFRVQQFDADLKFVRQIGRKGDLPGYFAEPKGVATDSEGHLYVVDGQFENVQLFNDQGQVLMDFGEEGNAPGQFWLPTTLCIEPRDAKTDRVFVADSYNRRVQVFEFRKIEEVRP